MKFSLILATLGRDKEVTNFLESLKNQSYKNFELIVVDQNQDGKIDNIIQEYKKNFFINHIKIKEKRLSHARNVGLKYVNGEIVAFPDDDCEYPENLLENVINVFQEKKGYKIITGISLDKKTKKQNFGKWLNKSCEINCKNIFQTVTSFSIFIDFSEGNTQFFDEKLGVGAYFSSAEEHDFLFYLLSKGYKGYYYPDKIFVYHPTKGNNFSDINDRKRSYSYGLGQGAFFKKHLIIEKNFCLFPSFIKLFFIRPVGGMLLGLLKFDLGMFLYYKNSFIGRWKGLIKYPKS